MEPYLLTIAGNSEQQLMARMSELRQLLGRRGDVGLREAQALRARAPHGQFRRALFVRTAEEAIGALSRAVDIAHEPREVPSVGLMFPGLGDQYAGMASELYRGYPVFRETVARCARFLEPLLGIDFEALLFPAGGAANTERRLDLRRMLRGAADDGLSRPLVAQPMVFIVEYALAQLVLSCGVRPAKLIGYSAGEYVAACLAGIFTLEESLSLLSERARAFEAAPPGAMLAVSLSEVEVRPLLRPGVELAAINGSAMCVLAGTAQALREVETSLNDREIPARMVGATRAFHSTSMVSAVAPVLARIKEIGPATPRLPIVSNLTGTWMRDEQARDPEFWARHMCEPIRFSDGLATLWKSEPGLVLLELGPGRTLSDLASNAPCRDARTGQVAVPTLRYHYELGSDIESVLRGLAELWVRGVDVDLPEPTDSRESANPACAAHADTDAPADTVVDEETAGVAAKLLQIWRGVFKREKVEMRDNFFELGGNSLLATRVVSQLKGQYGVRVPILVVLRNPVLAVQAAAIVRSLRDGHDGKKMPEIAAPQEPPAATGTPLVLPNGLEVFQLNPAETQQFYEDIFVHETYTRHGVSLPEDACVLDVGANIGLFSLFVHQRCRHARIHAFEPAPPLFDLLQRNVQLQGARGVVAHRCGISSSQGSATLTFYPRSSGMSSFHADKREEQDVLDVVMRNQLKDRPEELAALLDHSADVLEARFDGERHVCSMRTLGEVIDTEALDRIDLLKIDVQKSEYEVLLGIRASQWARISQIVMEVHDLRGRLQMARALLESQGYSIAVEQDPLYRGTCLYNLYARRVERS